MTYNIYKLFNRGIKWNTIEGFIYQSILTIHQLVLFPIAGCYLYGLIGILFSLLYLTILLLNFGFDKSLSIYFKLFIKNKENFNNFFLFQFFIQFTILLLIIISCIIYSKNIIELFSLKFNCQLLNSKILIILCLLLLFESLKKSLRMLGELAFLNKANAITEIILIILYVSIFWISWLLGYKIDLFLIFIPHLIQSVVGLIILSYIIKTKLYNKLPKTNETNNSNEKHNNEKYNKDLVKSIIFNRGTNYINQISHLMFSGNFLIPFLSSNYGIEKISVFKLINIVAVYFGVIFERTFGLTSSALLSNVKNASNYTKQNAVNFATEKLFTTLTFFIIFAFINLKWILSYYLINMPIEWISIYLFTCSIIIDSFFIVMEQFFIVEGQIYYFIFINLFLTLLFYGSFAILKLSLINILLLLLILRIMAYIFLRKILIQKLKIKLLNQINYKYVICFLIFSILFYFVFNIKF